jgi:hypothetical protein
MKGNFEECLKIVLKHEGGYVHHPPLDMEDKLSYTGGWLTQKNSLRKSTLLSKGKVRRFTKRWLPRTPELTAAVLAGVSMTPTPGAYAMRITSESAMAKTCPRPSGTEAREANAGNAIARLTAKGGGPFVRAITVKGAELSCDPSASRFSGDAVPDAGCRIHTTSMTSITRAAKERTLRLATQSKVLAQKSSHRKSQSAFFYAQTATG